jgi:hypothetical protein
MYYFSKKIDLKVLLYMGNKFDVFAARFGPLPSDMIGPIVPPRLHQIPKLLFQVGKQNGPSIPFSRKQCAPV